MFTYNHFFTNVLPVGFTGYDGDVGKSYISSGLFVEEYTNSLSAIRESYSTGTYARSVTSFVISKFTSDKASSTTSTTTTSSAIGNYSTGVDSHTFTAPATQTHSFTTQWFSNTATTLSGSASATQTTTGSRTLTMTGVTTLVPSPMSPSFTGIQWFVARELPFGTFPAQLRRVALAYGIGEVGATIGTRTFSTLTTGGQTYNSTRYATTSTTDVDGFGRSGTTNLIRNTVYNISDMGNGRADATGKRFQHAVFYGMGGTSGPAMSWDVFQQAISPTIAPDFSPFVGIAQNNIFSRRVFTDPESSFFGTRYSISGSSAALVWSYLSSSWGLFATLTNDSTSSTTQISLETSALASTTTIRFTTEIGPSTCVRGPIVPFLTSGLMDISVKLSASFRTTRTYVMHEGYGTSGTPTSSSSAYATTSSFSFSNGTANSNLPFFVSAPALSISTSSNNELFVIGGDAFDPIVGMYKNSKWNEAGTSDTISVVQ